MRADEPERSSNPARQERAEQELEAVFQRGGWEVQRLPAPAGGARPPLTVRQGQHQYVVEVMVAAEGRSDRLVPLWSQACLQAMRRVATGKRMAVVGAPRISPAAAERVLDFAAEYAPDVAAGVIDFEGQRMFRGAGLEGLDAEPPRGTPAGRAARGASPDLFSDLNQWLLKVLLAPQIPDGYLTAPRDRFRNPSQLARGAGVSVPSAYRFVQQLEKDNYLDESASYLRLVRRESLFARWKAAAARRVEEAPMRLLVRGDPHLAAASLGRGRSACLGLFAAAEALHLGFVHGVPPHVYVRRLGREAASGGGNLVPADPGESSDLFLRKAPAPSSIFRGAVERNGVWVSDVVQVWLDVSLHPSRGPEQADLIRRRVLGPVLAGEGD